MINFDTFVADYQHRMTVLKTSTNEFAGGIAYVDGEFTPLSHARIPLLDQGFLRSDLTYDVPAVWDGRFFRLDDHLDRLEASCARLRLTPPLERDELRRLLIEMVSRSGIRDAYVMVIVTRGLKFVRGATLTDLQNSLYAFSMPYHWIMSADMQRQGGKAVVTRTVRRVPPGAIDPTIKSFQWGDLIRAQIEAQDRGALYPILTDGDGNVTEGAGFNIVLVKNRSLVSPVRGVLEGITRQTIFGIAREAALPARLDFVPLEQLYDCDELFVCSTAGGVMPITTLDGAPVGDGKVGPITRQIWSAYWEAHYNPRLSFVVPY